MKGKIIKGIAGFYYVDTGESGVYECKAKGIFRKDKRKPLVGDDVEIEILEEEEKEGNLTALLPRKNELIRPAVANIDQALVIFALEDPRPNIALLDRFLVMMEQQEIPAAVCFNKGDLVTPEEAQAYEKVYQDCGYPVFLCSAAREEGIEELKEYLKGRTTVVAGPSGVGKSSLIKALDPSLNPRTGEISEAHLQGRHTTTFYEMYRLVTGGYIIDTPGIRGFGLVDLSREEIALYFPEMLKVSGDCRFVPCTHTHEPGCAVKEAVEAGKISVERYESYLGMLEEGGKYR